MFIFLIQSSQVDVVDLTWTAEKFQKYSKAKKISSAAIDLHETELSLGYFKFRVEITFWL